MMNELAARLSATLYVFGEQLGDRMRNDERGQTTAEYVGIVAFVAIIVVALFALSDGFKGQVEGIINAAFDKIKSGMG